MKRIAAIRLIVRTVRRRFLAESELALFMRKQDTMKTIQAIGAMKNAAMH